MAFIPGQTLQTGPFGEQVTAGKVGIVQIANKHRIDPSNRTDIFEVYTATGGSVDSSGNLFRAQTGTSAGGYGVIRSKETLNYRAGQGIECMFTATFTTGIASSLQFGGMFNLTDTVAFGYNGTSFSCLHSYGGSVEIQTIQVTATPTGGENCTVTLDGDAVVIALTASTVQTNAREITEGLKADATVSAKWNFEQIDDTVYCISKSAANLTGTMSFSSATATATVSEYAAGVAKTDNHIAQGSWNKTTSPFSGFDPTKLNIYRIKYGYLGVANTDYEIYNPNTGKFVLVHSIEWANANTVTHTGSPDFKVGWTAASLGSSGTNLTVTGASASLQLIGLLTNKNDTHSVGNSKAGVSTTLTNVITLENRLVFGGRYNLAKVLPIRISFNNDHNKGAVVEIYKNATLGGTPNYQLHDEYNSVVAYDTAGTTVTGGSLIDSFTVFAGGSETVSLLELETDLLPGDTLTVAAKAVSATATNYTVAVTWKEIK